MHRLILAATAVLFFSSVTGVYAQIPVTSDANYGVQLPVGSLFHIDWIHDATNFPSASNPGKSATSEAIACDYERFQIATIQVYSGTSVSGSITSASYEIYGSARALLSDATEFAPINVFQRANNADTAVWTPVATITTYGNFSFPIGGLRTLRILAHGQDSAARRMDIGLR